MPRPSNRRALAYLLGMLLLVAGVTVLAANGAAPVLNTFSVPV